MKQLLVRMPDETYKQLKEKSKQERISMTRLVEYFVSEGINDSVIKKVVER